MKRVLRHLVPMAALWLAATASAQQIKPGLWENTSQMGGAMGAPMAQMQQQMASMPPAQRKQMEAMLAQQGIRMDAQGVTSKAVSYTHLDVYKRQIHGCGWWWSRTLRARS